MHLKLRLDLVLTYDNGWLTFAQDDSYNSIIDELAINHPLIPIPYKLIIIIVCNDSIEDSIKEKRIARREADENRC